MEPITDTFYRLTPAGLEHFGYVVDDSEPHQWSPPDTLYRHLRPYKHMSPQERSLLSSAMGQLAGCIAQDLNNARANHGTLMSLRLDGLSGGNAQDVHNTRHEIAHLPELLCEGVEQGWFETYQRDVADGYAYRCTPRGIEKFSELLAVGTEDRYPAIGPEDANPAMSDGDRDLALLALLSHCLPTPEDDDASAELTRSHAGLCRTYSADIVRSAREQGLIMLVAKDAIRN